MLPSRSKLFGESEVRHKKKQEEAGKFPGPSTAPKKAADSYTMNKEYQESRPLDIIQIEKLFYYLDLIDKYDTELDFMKARSQELYSRSGGPPLDPKADGKPLGKIRLGPMGLAGIAQSMKLAQSISLSALQNISQLHNAENHFTSLKLCNERVAELQKILKFLVEKASEIDLPYTAVEDYIGHSEKEFIPMKRYFIPTEVPNYVYDVNHKDYLVDINFSSEPNLFEKFGDIITFVDENKLDRQQQKWFKRVPLKVHYLRPIERDVEGIYVDKDDRETQVKNRTEQFLESLQYYKTIDN